MLAILPVLDSVHFVTVPAVMLLSGNPVSAGLHGM